MLFSSLEFIFRFLPLFLIIYYLVPDRLKNSVLLIGSLIFYGLGEPVYVFLMLLSIIVNYAAAIVIEKKRDSSMVGKTVFVLAIIYNIGLLVFFKYLAFLINGINAIAGTSFKAVELVLPLGISFYTFQIVSYVADVYMKRQKAEKSFVKLGAYLSLFPQLIAGPIVLYEEVKPVLTRRKRKISVGMLEDGLRIFTIGLAGKVLLANRFGQIWEGMLGIGSDGLSTAAAWIGAAAYTLQIYFDFNGYSLMAIGLGKMLGFKFSANFNQPYTAGSVTAFWKRWHITLTKFFRNYVYIPLGGNRRGVMITLFNMFIVWTLTGLWHGASINFVIWGIYYFVFLAIERILFGSHCGLLTKPYERAGRSVKGVLNVLGHFYTLLVVVVGWIIFAITELGEMTAYLGRMFPFVSGMNTDGFGMEVIAPHMYVWFVVGAVFSTPLLKGLYEKNRKSLIASLGLLLLFWMCVIQLVDSVYNPFLYFRF